MIFGCGTHSASITRLHRKYRLSLSAAINRKTFIIDEKRPQSLTTEILNLTKTLFHLLALVFWLSPLCLLCLVRMIRGSHMHAQVYAFVYSTFENVRKLHATKVNGKARTSHALRRT